MIMGEIDGEAKIELTSKVGAIDIPVRQVARIDEAFAEEEKFTVTFTNGDRLTGTVSSVDADVPFAAGRLCSRRPRSTCVSLPRGRSRDRGDHAMSSRSG